MRKNFKNILKLFAIGAVFVLGGCSKETFDEGIYQNQITVKKVSLKEESLRRNFNLMNAVNKVRQKNQVAQNPTSRMVYDSINNFYFDDENGKYIEMGNKNSFTFPVYRDNGDGKVENIVFNKKIDGEYEPVLAKYNFTKEQMEGMSKNQLEQEHASFSDLSTSRAIVYICETVEIWVQNFETEGVLDGDPYSGGWVTISSNCYSVTVGYGNGNGSVGDHDGSTSFGGFDANGNPIITTPVGNNAGNPCNKIKKQNDKIPSIKQGLVSLASTTSQNHENGIFTDNTATASTPNPIQNIPNISANGASVNVNMNPSNPYTMIAHTHDATGPDGNGTYSIFSWDDLTTINALIQNNHIDPSNFVFYVITADGTTYAMTVDNASSLSNFFYNPANNLGATVDMNRLLETQKKYDKFYNPDIIPKGLIQVDTNPANDKENFLKFMKEANLGVSLFEVDATFSIYSKLSISSSGVVSPTPCN